MLQSILIGHLGADAMYKNDNGKEFVAFRVANTDRWTDGNGQLNEKTTWVDCILSGKPKVFDFLKKGQMVYVSGSVSLRVYSSAKDKCMKAGITINVKQIELLGGRADDVPAKLYTEDGKTEINVGKFFYAPQTQRSPEDAEAMVLVSRSGERFVADRAGWVKKESQPAE